MNKNNANIKKLNTDKEKKFKYFDWIILVLFVLSILSNILLFVSRPQLMNFVTMLLFQFWQLAFVIYFAVRITTFSLTDKTTEKQKSIAKTAIKQIRTTQLMTEKLMGIVSSKIDGFKDDKMTDTLKEINNHLSSLSLNIGSSESAFRDILGEEFKEEHLLWAKIKDSVVLLNKKVKLEKELRKKKEKEDKVRQSELQDEINELRSRISSDISSLPITGYVGAQPPHILEYKPINFSNSFDLPWGKKILDLAERTIPRMGEGIPIGEEEQKENKEEKQKKKTTKKPKK